MADALAIELHELAEVAAGSSNGLAVDLEKAIRTAAKLKLEVPALADGAVLELFFETARLEAGPWRLVRELRIVEVGEQDLVLGGLKQYVRARRTLTGGTATYAIAGKAHVLYCEPSDITDDAVMEAAISEIPMERRIAACITASVDAEGFVGNAYTLPLVAWDESLREKCALLAADKLFRKRGRDVEGGDESVGEGAKDALAWLKLLADGRVSPPGMVDSTPEINEGTSYVSSGEPKRRW